MKLQRAKSRTVGDKEYYKYILNPPAALIEGKGWKEGDEIEALDHKDGILLRRQKR